MEALKARHSSRDFADRPLRRGRTMSHGALSPPQTAPATSNPRPIKLRSASRPTPQPTVPVVQKHSADRKTRYRDEYERLTSRDPDDNTIQFFGKAAAKHG